MWKPSKYVNCCLKISCSVIMGTTASNQYEYISQTSMFNCKLVPFRFSVAKTIEGIPSRISIFIISNVMLIGVHLDPDGGNLGHWNGLQTMQSWIMAAKLICLGLSHHIAHLNVDMVLYSLFFQTIGSARKCPKQCLLALTSILEFIILLQIYYVSIWFCYIFAMFCIVGCQNTMNDDNTSLIA